MSAWMNDIAHGIRRLRDLQTARPHAREEGVDDLFVREIVGVVHDLLDLVHAASRFGATASRTTSRARRTSPRRAPAQTKNTWNNADE